MGVRNPFSHANCPEVSLWEVAHRLRADRRPLVQSLVSDLLLRSGLRNALCPYRTTTVLALWRAREWTGRREIGSYLFRARPRFAITTSGVQSPGRSRRAGDLVIGPNLTLVIDEADEVFGFLLRSRFFATLFCAIDRPNWTPGMEEEFAVSGVIEPSTPPVLEFLKLPSRRSKD
jgi:hypothetical protein